MLAAKTEDLDDSESGSSFTISTPSDSEMENMCSVGTLRSDGKLAPLGDTVDNRSTPVSCAGDSRYDNDADRFYTPKLKFTPKFRDASNRPALNRRKGVKGAAKVPTVTNPTYEAFSFDNVYGSSPLPTNRGASSSEEGGSSVYMTPCGAEATPAGKFSSMYSCG